MRRSSASQARVEIAFWTRGRRGLALIRRAAIDQALVFEERLGWLGPAHQRWRDNSAEENRRRWNGWDWTSLGEEWNSGVAEWKPMIIFHVMDRWIPSGEAVLEIGPGGGRWTEALLDRFSQVWVVDVAEEPLRLCRERFADVTSLECVLSPGAALPGVGDSTIDAVWSFDVFVHIAPLDQASYLTEISRVLRPGGIAVIHHSDGRNRGRVPSRHGWRAPMSRKLFGSLASARGFEVLAQFDQWGEDGAFKLDGLGDSFSVLRRVTL